MLKRVFSSWSLRSLSWCRPLGVVAESAAAQPATPAENISHAQDRKAVAVTIYNKSLALIREEREIKLVPGHNLLALREVSGQIQPETASLRSLSGARLTLLELNFDFDLLTPEALLAKYVGKTVTVLHSGAQSGKETREQAIVLANNDRTSWDEDDVVLHKGVVLKYADRIETGLPYKARIVYDGVPATLRDKPTLLIDLDSDQGGTQRTELSYLSGGLSWHADYVAALADDEQTLTLSGWVTLTNKSGATYENATLQLVAGDVHRTLRSFGDLKLPPVSTQRFSMRSGSAPLGHEELFDYHLYTLHRPTTLRDQQTKQVTLLTATRMPVQKEYRMEGSPDWYYEKNRTPERGDKRGVDVFVEFTNKNGDPGQPLPKGIVRVYKKDKEGRPLFIGEDGIDHTPKNEQVRLRLGKAFDIFGNWKRTDFSRIADKVTEIAIAIELSNAKDIPTTVRMVEPVPGDWEMLQESHPHIKAGANLAMWDIAVPANGKTMLTYRVRMNW